MEKSTVCICGVAEVLSLERSLDQQTANPQITNLQITTKIGFENHKFAKCHICGRSANPTKCFKSANLWISDLRKLFAGLCKWGMETEENKLWLRWSLLGVTLKNFKPFSAHTKKDLIFLDLTFSISWDCPWNYRRLAVFLQDCCLMVSACVLYDWPVDSDISCALEFLLLNT